MIQIFSYSTPYNLQEGMNEWLKKNDVAIVDIKFSTSVCYCVDSIVNNYSSMIIYEE